MIVANHTLFAQYPTQKNIKGQDVVIMTVPQAQAIDNRFLNLKDSIKLLNVSLFQNKQNLKLTNETLIKTNNSLSKTQDSLKQSFLLNDTYLREIEKYKKMEFEDAKVRRTVQIGLVAALTVWLTIFLTGLSQQ